MQDDTESVRSESSLGSSIIVLPLSDEISLDRGSTGELASSGQDSSDTGSTTTDDDGSASSVGSSVVVVGAVSYTHLTLPTIYSV